MQGAAGRQLDKLGLMLGGAGDRLTVLGGDGFPQRTVGADQFQHRDPAFVAAVPALLAALGQQQGLSGGEGDAQAGEGRAGDAVRRIGARAAAQARQQALRDDAAQGRAQGKRFNPQVQQPGNRRRRIVGMDGRQHQMAGQAGLDGNARRFRIADLADENDVRVLAQNGA